MHHRSSLPVFISVFACLSLAACGGGSSSSDSGSVSGVSLSGSIAVASGDAVQAASVGSNPLPDATVSVYQMFPDGTEVLVDTTTADGSGNYSFDGLEPASSNAGSTNSFYYEVRATSGTLEIRAPAAPTADDVVDITPESNLAAKILSEVAEIPFDGSLFPTPEPELIEATRELVEQNADMLNTAITIPSTGTGSANEASAMANGLAAAGGNAEKMYKALQFDAESEWLGDPTNNATAGQAGEYARRLVREACSQPAEPPLTEASADVIGTALMNGDSFTVTELVTAYNNAVPQTEQIAVADAVNGIQSMLASVSGNLDASAANAADFANTDQLILYAKRGLGSVTADTTLQPDQAIPFLLAAVEANNGNGCALSPDILTSVVSDLTGDTTLAAPHIADVEIYHDSGFGCNEGAGEGHFRASVKVFAPGLTVNSVEVTSTDTTALSGNDGNESLTLQGNAWIAQTDGVCVTLGTPVTYTITATLSDNSTVSATVDRNHPLIPQATAQVGGANASTDSANPDIVRDLRPVYSWDDPDVMLANITNAPAGSAVKYQYEFAHVDITDNPVAPLAACDQVPYGPMYAVNHFLPTADCDPAACATAAAKTAANIACRINIQTFLVDGADKLLGQAAGNFTFFCVDSNGDGICGD
ncbi:MAG TPA: hypothetical protein ENJ79_04425 [Gammaproteobacteria bacterium]|nr:hypothetical protein [Gammaproteobacteria bacterium]